MTNSEKAYITHYRQAGYGLAEIARTLGLPSSTVKAFCRRGGIVPLNENADESAKLTEGICLNCGATMSLETGHKQRKFCSDACRLTWWHAHRYMAKNAVEHTCPACGRTFRTSRTQTYCSLDCFMDTRFGGDRHGRRTHEGTV